MLYCNSSLITIKLNWAYAAIIPVNRFCVLENIRNRIQIMIFKNKIKNSTFTQLPKKFLENRGPTLTELNINHLANILESYTQ